MGHLNTSQQQLKGDASLIAMIQSYSHKKSEYQRPLQPPHVVGAFKFLEEKAMIAPFVVALKIYGNQYGWDINKYNGMLACVLEVLGFDTIYIDMFKEMVQVVDFNKNWIAEGDKIYFKYLKGNMNMVMSKVLEKGKSSGIYEMILHMNRDGFMREIVQALLKVDGKFKLPNGTVLKLLDMALYTGDPYKAISYIIEKARVIGVVKYKRL